MKKKRETIKDAIVLALKERLSEVERKKTALMPNYDWMVECDEKIKVLSELLNAFKD